MTREEFIQQIINNGNITVYQRKALISFNLNGEAFTPEHYSTVTVQEILFEEPEKLLGISKSTFNDLGIRFFAAYDAGINKSSSYKLICTFKEGLPRTYYEVFLEGDNYLQYIYHFDIAFSKYNYLSFSEYWKAEKKNTLEDKIKAEFNQFFNEFIKKDIPDIIANSAELVWKENIRKRFDLSESLCDMISEEQYVALLAVDNPLELLYQSRRKDNLCTFVDAIDEIISEFDTKIAVAELEKTVF